MTEVNGIRRYDGLRFENLVRDILGRFFSGTWSSTSRSWDGGRDFVDRSIEGEEQWAECKMYRSALSLRVLSPTLVMAIMGKIRSLLLFSFSEVNAPARRHLARLGRDQGMDVLLYDGDTLDGLILAAPDVRVRYFGEADDAQQPDIEALPLLSGRLTRDLEFELSDLSTNGDERLAPELILDLHAPVILELFLKNQSPLQPLRCTIDLGALNAATSPLRLFRPEEARSDINLRAGEIKALRYVMRASAAGVHRVPSIAVEFDRVDGTARRLPIPFPTRRINASLIRHPPLIGAAYLRSLSDLASFLSLSSRFKASVVHGRSGVGKSRFLEELGYRLVAAGRVVVQLSPANFRGLDWRSVIRSVVARLTAMPDPSQFQSTSQEGVVSAAVRDDVTRLLYDHTEGDEAAFLADALKIIQERLQVAPRILLVDDLQGFDPNIVAFFQSLDRRLRGLASGGALVVGVNIDFVAENRTAVEYYLELLGRTEGGLGETGRAIIVEEFSEGQAAEFVDNLLSTGAERGGRQFSAQYPELLRAVLAKVEPRPLALWQLIHLWVDRGLLIATDNSFVIADLAGLQQSLQEAWRLLEGVLKQRVALLRRDPAQWQALQTVTLFGEMSQRDLNDFAISRAVVEQLLDQAFLRRNGSDGVDFYHGAVARAVHELVSDSDPVLVDGLRRVWRGKRRRHVWSRRPVAGFNLDTAADLPPLAPEAALRACGTAATPTLQSQRAASRLLRALREQADPRLLLPSAIGLTRHAGSLEGRAGKTRRLIEIAPDFDAFRPSSADELRLFATLLASTGSQALSDGFWIEARAVLESWEARLTREIRAGRAPAASRSLRARVRNRMCVLYKDLGLHEEARRRARQSLRECRADGNAFLACLNHVDMGYLHYGDYSQTNEAVKEWNKAADIFRSARKTILSMAPEAEHFIGLTSALCSAMSGSVHEAQIALQSVATTARLNQDVYYHLQASVMAQILALHLALTHMGRLSRSRQLVLIGGFQALEDRAATLNIERFLRPIQYGRAVCLMAGEASDPQGAMTLLDTLADWAERGHWVSPLAGAVLYDWVRMTVQLHGEKGAERRSSRRLSLLGDRLESAVAGKAAPPITTFWTSGFNLPYA